MARTHISGPWVTTKGYEQKISGTYKTIVDTEGSLYQQGVKITSSADTLNTPNSIKSFSETVVFDTIGAAGVYTGDVTLPAGSIIENIIITNVALTNQGTSAVMNVGDFTTASTPVAIDADGFFKAINLKATDLLADESIDFYRTGGKEGAYLPYTTDGQDAASHVTDRYSATARLIRGVVTTVGTTSSTGKVLMTVVYSTPDPVSATFAAS